MPETAQAPTANETPETAGNAAVEGNATKQARSVDFPEAPENAAPGSGHQFDILLDMDVPVSVVLGETQIPVRRLLQLGPGAVLKLNRPIEAPADLFLKESKFAEAEVVVVDNQFAVRITQITGTSVNVNAPQAQ